MAQKMDKNLFKRIGDVPNAQESWMFVSDAVASELIGNDVFSLPYVQDGPHYQLGDIMLKEEMSLIDQILRKTPSVIRVGHLNGFLKRSDNEKDNQAILSSVQNYYEYTETNFNPNYVFVKETTKKSVKKSIRVEIEGCIEVCLTNIPEETSLSVSFAERGLDFFTKFYLISTLYRAQKVRIQVRINDQTDEYITSSPDWTIGFKVHRYNFNQSGDIEAPLEKSPKSVKMSIIPKFLFPGFPEDLQQPILSETPNHDREPEMRESPDNDLNLKDIPTMTENAKKSSE